MANDFKPLRSFYRKYQETEIDISLYFHPCEECFTKEHIDEVHQWVSGLIEVSDYLLDSLRVAQLEKPNDFKINNAIRSLEVDNTNHPGETHEQRILSRIKAEHLTTKYGSPLRKVSVAFPIINKEITLYEREL